MEESTRAHACKYNYDNIHNMPIRDTAMFQRSYGSVKLTREDGEETEDEYGFIVDDIQQDNENVLLTRERNNFDLINLNSSHNSSPKKCIYAPENSIACFIGRTNEKNAFNDSFHESYTDLVPKNFDGETKEGNLEAKKEIVNDLHLKKSNSMCSNGNSTSIDSINEDDCDSFIEINPCSSLKIDDSATDKQCLQNYKISDSQGTTMDFRDLKSIGSKDEKEDYSLPFHGIRNENLATKEDVDSDDSYKWNKKMNDTAYNAHFFYNTEYQISNKTITLHEDDDKQNLSERDPGRSALLIECQNLIPETDSAPDGTIISREDSFSDIIDNDSIDSEENFRSTSSEFESAMSSNDIMSPFGTPRDSLSRNITDSGTGMKSKNQSVHFTSFTSENIPKTLNRICMNKVDKIVSTVPQNKIDLVAVDKLDRVSNKNIAGSKNVHRSQSIRKLLNLTSQKKLVSTTRKESLNDNQKESKKLVCFNNKDKKINLKELYSNKRTKVIQPLFPSYDGDKVNPRKMRTCSVEVNGNCCRPSTNYDNVLSSKSVTTRTFKTNSVSDEMEKEKLKVDVQTVIPPRDQPRFVSKIPRPVSRRESHPRIQNIHKSFAPEINVKEKHSNNLQRISKLDKTETIYRPSDDSESSYKATLSKLKEEKTNCKNGSKLHMNTAKIVSIRSKYWMKEDKQCFSSFGSTLRRRDDKKPDIKKDDGKKNKSNVNLTPQTMRQGSRLSYGKMVRVKTAPIKSDFQLQGKMVKEPSKADTALSQIKSSRIPSKVVSIGSLDAVRIGTLDANKIH